MSLLRFHAPKALPPAGLHRGSTTSRTDITRWALHPRGQSTARTFTSPSQARSTDSPPWRFSQPYEGRSHHEQRKANVKNANRAVIITGLDYDVTVTELLQSIARTAPVGAISSAFLLPRQSRHAYYPNPRSRWPPARGDMLAAGAKVSFNQRWAAMELVRLAREKVFRVRDRAPFVTEDRSRSHLHADGPPPPLSQYVQTRVLVLEGPPRLEGFDEPAIRQLLRSNGAAMMDAGPYGDLSEPVVTKDLKNGVRRMEWRFFSYAAQALPFKKIIRLHFGNRLTVRHGRDPCCPVQVWEEERRRNREQSAALFAKKARKRQERRIGALGKDGGRKSPESTIEAPKFTTKHTPEEGSGRSLDSPIWAWQPTTEQIPPKERHLDNATMAADTDSELLSAEIKVEQGRQPAWNEHLDDRLMTRRTAAEQTNGPFAHDDKGLIWKEELDVADQSVTGENNVDEATETATAQHINITYERGMGPKWKEEHVADEIVARETTVEHATESAVEKALETPTEQVREDNREHSEKEGHLETAIVALVTTAEQNVDTHAEQGRHHIGEDEHREVGSVSRETIADHFAEATADQDRERVDESRNTIGRHLHMSLALTAVEAR